VTRYSGEIFVDARLAATRESNMNNRLHVGNLAFDTTDETLRSAFADCGEVLETKIVNDRETGRSRGFGFVVMATAEAAQQAISRMNGAEVDGRPLRVDEAVDRPRRSGAFGSGPGGDRRGPR
jgi:RNA recognition motif-containing protein